MITLQPLNRVIIRIETTTRWTDYAPLGEFTFMMGVYASEAQKVRVRASLGIAWPDIRQGLAQLGDAYYNHEFTYD